MLVTLVIDISTRRFSPSHRYDQTPSKVRFPSKSYVRLCGLPRHTNPPFVLDDPEVTVAVCHRVPVLVATVISRWKYSILRSVLLLFTVTLLVASATPRMSLYPGVVMLVY